MQYFVFNRHVISSYIRIVLAVLLLAFIFTACHAEQTMEQPPDIATNNNEIIPAQTLDADENDNPSDSSNRLPLILSEPLFDFNTFANLPTTPPSYEPQIQVIPLTKEYVYYGGKPVYGSVAFIDNQLNQISLPEGNRSWFYTTLEETKKWSGENGGSIYGYVIEIDGKSYYLDVSGALFPDFYPEQIWGADMAHYELRNGYLLAAIGETQSVQLCGVMDLRTMQDVLPPIYDAISLDEATIWAIKDGEEFLFDYAGKLLQQSQEQTGSYDNSGFRSLEELWGYNTYRTLYLPTVLQHENMIIAYAPNQGLSIFSDDGTHLCSIAEENLWQHYDNLWGYFKDEGKIIVRFSDGNLMVVYADGQRKQINLPADIVDEQFKSFSYEDNTLTIIDWEKEYYYHTDSGLLEEGKKHAYLDENTEHFSVKYKRDSWIYNDPIDIFNADGELLLQGVFAANYYEPAFPSTMVVWLDETHCVLLNQNGNITPIPPYTTVEYFDMHY